MQTLCGGREWGMEYDGYTDVYGGREGVKECDEAMYMTKTAR